MASAAWCRSRASVCDILQQLAAAEAALNRISLAVLKHHVEMCVPDGIAKGEPEQSRRLAELVDIFDRFAQVSRLSPENLVSSLPARSSFQSR